LQYSLPTFEEYLQSDTFKQGHHNFALANELHAEMNAIIWAARRGIEIAGADIYTTYSPCIFCTKAIIQAGIKRVFYNVLYDRPEGQESLNTLLENNIVCQILKVKE
jgi:dCMP deaminase